MATLTIRDAQGGETGKIDVADAVFAVEPNRHAVRQALLAYEANQRRGTHATKTRGQVSGGGRKPFRQKGTGRARQGSSRSAQMRGGSIIFGPTPRSYEQKVNRKVRRNALQSALSDLRNSNSIIVLNGFEVGAPKTKTFAALLDRLGAAEARRVLVVMPGLDTNVLLSARNLPNVMVTQAENLNIYDLLTCDRLITTADGIKKVEELLG